MTRTTAQARDWVDHGTRLVAGAAGSLTEETAGQPSALPGWTRKHLLAHLAGNADALGNLVRWAATGEPTPMYASSGQRAADIAAGSRLRLAELAAWFDSSAAALAAGLDDLPADRWGAEVVTAQGRRVAASEICWLRAREVMVHAVDLAAGLRFADLPAEFVAALVDDIVVKRSSAGAGPTLVVRATDSPRTWTVRGNGIPRLVAGETAALAAYLAGRGEAGVHALAGDGTPDSNPPTLPPWL